MEQSDNYWEWNPLLSVKNTGEKVKKKKNMWRKKCGEKMVESKSALSVNI